MPLKDAVKQKELAKKLQDKQELDELPESAKASMNAREEAEAEVGADGEVKVVGKSQEQLDYE